MAAYCFGAFFEIKTLLGLEVSNLVVGAKLRFVRIGEIYVFRFEGPFCSLSFEFERYGPQAYHLDCRAFLV